MVTIDMSRIQHDSKNQVGTISHLRFGVNQ